jgi:hypothetical protein
MIAISLSSKNQNVPHQGATESRRKLFKNFGLLSKQNLPGKRQDRDRLLHKE